MNKTKKIILSKQQKEIMQLFYAVAPTKIVISKREYDKLWKALKKGEKLTAEQETKLQNICPAIVCEVQKSIADNVACKSSRYICKIRRGNTRR